MKLATWIGMLFLGGAIAGLTTVCLVMYYGLTRLLYAIARDGLLPRSLATLSEKSRSPTRIIYVTALGSPEDVTRALGTDADDYIVKPYRPERLRERIQHWLREGPRELEP